LLVGEGNFKLKTTTQKSKLAAANSQIIGDFLPDNLVCWIFYQNQFQNTANSAVINLYSYEKGQVMVYFSMLSELFQWQWKIAILPAGPPDLNVYSQG
jgi:hypothetical protein